MVALPVYWRVVSCCRKTVARLHVTSAHWTPPANPDPFAILHSAVDDTSARLYEKALAKFLWFHDNAVQLQPSLAAVRLSFAISYWLELASLYPPAQRALVETRDRAEASFRNDTSNFHVFLELRALNRELGDNRRTANVFIEVAKKDHENAMRLYPVAERSLIEAGRYRECGPFLNPTKHAESAIDLYQLDKEHETSRDASDPPLPKSARPSFINRMATLAGLLVLNDRIDDAKKVYDAALRIVDDAELRTTMEASMTGHLPKPRFG
jgi:hypothetical protein